MVRDHAQRGVFHRRPLLLLFGGNWDRLLAATNYLAEGRVTLFENNEEARRLIAFHTAHGDGVYEDEDGNQYPVDAGMIGAIPVELIDSDKLATIRRYGNMGHFAEFRTHFICEANHYNLRFGRIRINTDIE